MAYKTPAEITVAATASGVAKAGTSWDRLLVGGFLAGAYIAFASLLAVVVSAGLDPKTGTITLVTGAAFSLGLILVVIAGSELLTGNMALLPLAALQGKIGLGALGRNFGLVLLGNLAGSLFVAYVLAVKTGVITAPQDLARLTALATAKGDTETTLQIFLRAMGCNWLVCLAVWMALAADDIGGKVLAIFFPITAFVALGFDHVVANMFFLPAAHFAGVDAISWGDVVHNLVFAFLGNIVGAAVFVAGGYYLLFGREEPGMAAAPATADGGAASRRAEPAGSGAGVARRG